MHSIRLVVEFVLALLRHPKHLRSLGALVLEDEFYRTSPLPELETKEIYSHEVILPPPSMFRWGNQDPEGLVFLISMAKQLGARKVFEIGTFNGATAWCLARNLPEAEVHTLDLPPGRTTQLRIEGSGQAAPTRLLGSHAL